MGLAIYPEKQNEIRNCIFTKFGPARLDGEQRPRDSKNEQSRPDAKKIDSATNLRPEMASCAIGRKRLPVQPG